MTAIGTAARPGFGRFRIGTAVAAAALIVGLVAGVALGTAVARSTAPAPQAVAPASVPAAAPEADVLGSYLRLASHIQAAEFRQDHRSLVRYGSQLFRMLDAETVGAVYLAHRELQSQLAAALARGEGYRIADFRSRIAELCGPKTVQRYLDFCH